MENYSKLIAEEWVFVDFSADSFQDLVDRMACRLEAAGYVKDTFRDALLQREAEYPTGLRFETFGVSIPHTDEIHVIKEGIVVVKLKEPITVTEIATIDNQLDVKYVFMLLLKKADSHADLLQKLVMLFTDQMCMKRLDEEKTVEGVYRIINGFLQEN